MIRPWNFEECLVGSTGCVKKVLTRGKGDDVVKLSMDDQCRLRKPGDLIDVAKLMRTSFLCGEYKEIGLVCQTEFNLMMLWRQLVD